MTPTGDYSVRADTPTNGRELRRALKSDIRRGFFTAVWFVALLFAVSYGLRTLGVGRGARTQSAHTAATVESLQARSDTVIRLLREIQTLVEK